jgi:hypothetical protein
VGVEVSQLSHEGENDRAIVHTKEIKMGLTHFPHGISVFGTPIYGTYPQDNSGTTFFVDNNCGSDSNDGLSWDSPLKTFARATVLNNIDIARGSDRWARRNTIYYAADTETATIVAFPNKCDVIGVGSYDANTKPGITGNHAPVNTGNYGTRFINIWFKAPVVAAPIITLASTSSGIQFVGCTFDGAVGTVTTAITAVASPFLNVEDCDIFGAFATGYIALGAGEAASTTIKGNWMRGSSGLGISANSTTTSYQVLVQGNIVTLVTTGLCVDDNTDLLYLVGNRFTNAATLTNYAGYTGILDVNIARCVDNICMGGDVSMRVPKVVVA